MKIDLSVIDANPHRDLSRNPLEAEQISHVAASIGRTGFWENVVVREHPDVPGRYQLAYGHNRLAALRERGETVAEFIVKPLSDYDMLVAMIDENATQRNQTARIVFENITAAIRLAEKMLLGSENVHQFNELARTSHYTEPYNGILEPAAFQWRAEDYQRAKNCVVSGEGLGRGFLEHFLPQRSSYHSNTYQAAIDSYYAESRKTVALKKVKEEAEEARKREAEAQEARRQAEEQRRKEREARAREAAERQAREAAERQVREATNEAARRQAEQEARRRAQAEQEARNHAAAARREVEARTKAETKSRERAAQASANAAKAQKKAERIEYVGFDRDLLEQLPSASHMQELVQLARTEKIPSTYHARLVQACLDDGWTTGGGRSNQVPHTILNAGKVWWFKASGRAERQRQQTQRENLKWKHREKTLDEFVTEVAADIRAWIKALDAIKPFTDQIENSTLVASFDARLGAIISVAQAVRERLPRPANVVPMDLKRLNND